MTLDLSEGTFKNHDRSFISILGNKSFKFL